MALIDEAMSVSDIKELVERIGNPDYLSAFLRHAALRRRKSGPNLGAMPVFPVSTVEARDDGRMIEVASGKTLVGARLRDNVVFRTSASAHL